MAFLDENGLFHLWRKITGLVDNAVPPGSIVMWSGSVAPSGWAICNGQNGTPDLSGRFVLGVSSTKALGSTGGVENVSLTAAQMPAHSHTVYYGETEKSAIAGDGNVIKEVASSSATSHSLSTATTNTGSGQAHDNMPPYYVLAYIMKL